ncbi:hypothetical protein TSUD_251700 [Trifolium subterraneum]|uniref:RIN4 pathogenic type III effector avirulence factor Avr cleavage site domain-containing protein n=1 Tax=Trifolium subterraneum TaxID=3900 RepID=A0A2Z6M9J5_TRISU|nr:hypothetical protein TSUD_251700 [Trifolium subterraneum]
MSVPQFGGWDQKAPGATDYSMVFAQARTNKKNQKSDLAEVKRTSLVNEPDATKANHGHHHARPASAPAPATGHHARPARGHARPQVHSDAHIPEDPAVVMVRPFSLFPVFVA